MQKQENKLANGMFVKEHTFKSGTKVINLSIRAADFIQFMKDNIITDAKGTKWVNVKLIPNKNTTKYTHTPILNEFTPKPADVAANNLAMDIFHKASPEERAIVEKPAEEYAGNTNTLIKDLPF